MTSTIISPWFRQPFLRMAFIRSGRVTLPGPKMARAKVRQFLQIGGTEVVCIIGFDEGIRSIGYRLALLATGAGALFIADQVGWTIAYMAMAAMANPLYLGSLNWHNLELTPETPGCNPWIGAWDSGLGHRKTLNSHIYHLIWS